MGIEKSVLYEVKDRIGYITLNRPERNNGLGRLLCGELHQTWLDFEADPDAVVALITGAGKSFCAGADLSDTAKPGEVDEPYFLDRAMPNLGVQVSKPIVAAINGWAIGAGLALCSNCDIRVASEKARFSFPEVKVGICAGGIELIHSMQSTTVVEMMLTGEAIDAQRALQAGFLNRVVAPEDLIAEAEKYCNLLKRNAPLTMKMIKAYILEERMTLLQKYHMMHAVYIRPQEKSEDFQEGRAAAKEKRAPQFKGR